MAKKYRDLEQRLICNSFVDLEDSGECWIWLGRRLPDGYGLINVRVDGKHKALRAHRVAYTELTGDTLGPDEEIDHICHVRFCINPNHLRKVTKLQNLANRRGYRS